MQEGNAMNELNHLDVSHLVPRKMENYFKFGAYEDIEQILDSKMFLPVFMTGLSRSGKTVMIEQACANTNRPMIRVNITQSTNEDDLIGGFRLKNGETVWVDGPVIVAMELGAILLLDEVDLASPECMCLQPILEGSSIFIKKIKKMIHPAPGFNIMATANTKGQGDDRGKFVGTGFLNEAFLDRFSLTIEHHYPNKDVEIQIIHSYVKDKPVTKIDLPFVQYLVKWADEIRENYKNEHSSDLISTGRLIHIIKAYKVFKNPWKAVRYGISRFSESQKEVFWEMFSKHFPYKEGDLSINGEVNNKRFMKRISEEIDLGEFNTKYKMPPATT